MTSTCPESSALQGLLDGALPENAQAELAEHLEGCPRCRAALDQLATDGRSYTDLARNLQQSSIVPEPGLQRVLDQAVSATDPAVTQGESPADVKNELPFLTPSTKPGHLGRLDHYEVHSVIGKGGFGVVLKGFDERLHRVVAIKVL
jgi:eukaryotic-like serine/threonine-protein kinase